MLVSVIIPTYNRRDSLRETLASLAHQTFPADRSEVIVVDDGSTDGTAEAVTAQYPDDTVLMNPENLGFVEENNVGIRRAMVRTTSLR
jgi:glycosyltransferase involved in cell wall biosynthesis